MDHVELHHRPPPPGIVEGLGKLIISFLDESVQGEVSLVRGIRGPGCDLLDVRQHTLAKPLQRDLPQLPEDLPIRLWESSPHYS